MNRDNEVLIDLLHYAKLAAKRARDKTKDELEADADLQSLLFHPLLILGEAVKRLSPEFRARSAEIPWDKIAGMRDRLIHAYDRVDWQVV